MNEFNQLSTALKKIYVRREKEVIYFSHNDQETHNTVKATIDAINKANNNAIKNGWKNIVIVPVMHEGNNLDSYAINIKGISLETGDEYRQRIAGLRIRAQLDIEKYQLSYQVIPKLHGNIKKYDEILKSNKKILP